MTEIRVLHEKPRGCGHRKAGGGYLTGEPKTLGTLPLCVTVDPPIPVDCDVIPFSRGVYMADLDAILTEEDQRLWLSGTSKASLKERDHRKWEIEQYGMTLYERCRTGICAGMVPGMVEIRLAMLVPFKDVYMSDYILAIQRAGKGRRVTREVARMTEARLAKDWKGLLAAAWRLAGYEGDIVNQNVKRIMVGLGAMEDAVLF